LIMIGTLMPFSMNWTNKKRSETNSRDKTRQDTRTQDNTRQQTTQDNTRRDNTQFNEDGGDQGERQGNGRQKTNVKCV
jgi:hypothetical protein